jgi:DNA-directed RNA polymerase specialized sigma24 family protein
VGDQLHGQDRPAFPAEFERFYTGSFPLVAGRVFLMVGDWHAAEDLAQDAMLTLMDQWADRCGRSNADNVAWTLGIAANLSRRYRRRLAVHAKALGRLVGLEQPSIACFDVDVVARADTYRRLSALPRQTRTVAVLWLLAGMTAEEIGGRLNITSSTVRTYLQRIRKHFDDGDPGGIRKSKS